MKIAKNTLLICFAFLFLFGCRKLYLEPLAKEFANLLWEDRPKGVSCTPVLQTATLENNEITFNTDHMLCVELTMNHDDFETMRNESRFGPSIQQNDGQTATAACLEYALKCGTPFPSEYNWYTADVNIDGHSLQHVGVRKKGFLGSIFSTAPGMLLKFEKYTSDQSIGTTTRITLNNNAEDPSRIAQVLNYKFLEMLGYPAPRCNYANVTVNGEALGVYAHLEPVEETFLDRHFGNHTGNLYEGQLVDFVEKWSPRWEAKTDYTESLANPLRAISKVIKESENDEFIEEVSKHLNLDLFVTFWAAEVILQHNDGYGANRNNFFVYMNPSDANRIVLIPWGLNYFRDQEDQNNDSLRTYIRAEIPRKLSLTEEGRTMMENEVQRILDEVWSEGQLLTYMNNYALLVQTAQDNPNYEAQIDKMEEWITSRRKKVESMLSTGIPIGKENGGKCI